MSDMIRKSDLLVNIMKMQKPVPYILKSEEHFADWNYNKALLACAELVYKTETVDVLPDVQFVDAVPVVHGEWLDANYDDEIKFGRHLYFCSVCNKHADSFVGGTEDWWCSRKPNYCPNCGARMDGGKNDNQRNAR